MTSLNHKDNKKGVRSRSIRGRIKFKTHKLGT